MAYWDEGGDPPPMSPASPLASRMPWGPGDPPEIRLRLVAIELEHMREQTAHRLRAKANRIGALEARQMASEDRQSNQEDRVAELTLRVDRNTEKIETNAVNITKSAAEIVLLQDRTKIIGEVSDQIRRFVQSRNLILAVVIVAMLVSGKLSVETVAKWLGVP